jgi:hypothetical protein
MSSYELLDYPEYSIVLLETFPCNSKDKLRAQEQHHIDQNWDKCVNMHKAYTGLNRMNIWHKGTRKNEKTYQRDYRRENKEKIANRRKQRIDCECGRHYTLTCKADQ